MFLSLAVRHADDKNTGRKIIRKKLSFIDCFYMFLLIAILSMIFCVNLAILCTSQNLVYSELSSSSS